MSLKIVGGIYKGLRLDTPSSQITRPTAEVLREAVFNMCQHKIGEALFLDLYAGSGAMGVEALSRGAKSAFFVENHPQALKALKKNLSKVAEGAHLYPYDVNVALKKLQNTLFDIVYIDPPYGDKEDEIRSESHLMKVLHLLDEKNLLQQDAWVFVEFSAYANKEKLSSLPLIKLKWHSSRIFGRSILHLFKQSTV